MLSIEILQEVAGHLRSPVSDPTVYEQDLVSLSTLVKETSQSDVARVKLAAHMTFSETVIGVLEANHLFYSVEPLATLYLRVFRGFLLSIRNVVMKTTLENSLVCFSLTQFVQTYSSHELTTPIVAVYTEILANNVRAKDDMLAVLLSLVTTKEVAALDEKQQFLVLVFAQRCLEAPEAVSALLTEDQNAPIVWYLVSQLDKAPDSSPAERILVSILQLIVSHESYSSFLTSKVTDEAKLLEVLRASRLIVTSSDEWDNYQVAAILAWLYEYFKTFCDESLELLSSKDFDTERLLYVHAILVVILDAMADMGKLNAARQFLEHYKAIDYLVPLLGVVHREVERKTLKNKKVEDISNSAFLKEFPEVKNFLIELITYLAHESFETQEKVRELHGLEVVLSSCIIDDNNPYMKERAIVCLKTLLLNNSGNQKFVAELEAQRTADDSALREAGYEVEVVDGKVQVKKLKQNV